MTPPEDDKPNAAAADPEEAGPGDDDQDSLNGDAMRALLKRSMSAGSSPAPETDLLRGVQRKLRTRSKGKFYADGWSTTQSRINYALVAVAMLVVIAVAYFALGPTGISH